MNIIKLIHRIASYEDKKDNANNVLVVGAFNSWCCQCL